MVQRLVRDQVTYISSRVQNAESLERRPIPGGSLIYPLKGLNITGDGSRSDTLTIELSQNDPLFMLACICVNGTGSRTSASVYFNLNGTRLTDFPHTGIGSVENVRTLQAVVLQTPGAGTHEIYAELVEDTMSADYYGEWSGFVIVGTTDTGEVETS